MYAIKNTDTWPNYKYFINTIFKCKYRYEYFFIYLYSNTSNNAYKKIFSEIFFH